MQQAETLLRDFRATMGAARGAESDPRQLKKFVDVCTALAVTFLKSKFSVGKLNLQVIGLNIYDLAHDCISDLFQRDETGKLIQLEAYFSGIPFDETPDEELLAHLRRLIFAKVNQSLFRIYNEVDPSLGKIYRNIRLAVNTLGNFTEVIRFGEPHLLPSFCDPLEHLPPVEACTLEQELISSSKKNARIPEMISALSLFLRNQNECSRLVPVMTAAMVIRSVFEKRVEIETHAVPADQRLTLDDALATVSRVCRDTKREMMPRYVLKKKVDPHMFENFFNAIEHNLVEVLIGGNGQPESLYNSLKKFIPEMSEEEYKKNHKNKLAYLCRLTRKQIVAELKG